MKPTLFGFLFLQIIIDLAHTVTSFPFVHYGMFSESFARQDSIEVFEIKVNGNILRGTDFRIYRWDMMHAPLSSIENEMKTRDFSFDREKMEAGMKKVRLEGFYRVLEPNLINPGDLTVRFPHWYKTYLTGLLGYSIQTLRVDKAWYGYGKGRYILLRKENMINIGEK